jgi:flavin reductase (DIM6/NTAB) family NADH-FMN oxidoreductase RutF
MDKKIFEKVAHSFSYGLYVIGSASETSVATIIANWVTQVSFGPPLFAASIETESTMNNHIKRSKFYTINILSSENKELARALLKPSVPVGNTINGKEFSLSPGGGPYLKDALAAVECQVISSIVAGDHTIFVGEVVDAIALKEGDPLTLKEIGWRYYR